MSWASLLILSLVPVGWRCLALFMQTTVSRTMTKDRILSTDMMIGDHYNGFPGLMSDVFSLIHSILLT